MRTAVERTRAVHRVAPSVKAAVAADHISCEVSVWESSGYSEDERVPVPPVRGGATTTVALLFRHEPGTNFGFNFFGYPSPVLPDAIRAGCH